MCATPVCQNTGWHVQEGEAYMKKILALFLLAALAVSLAACNPGADAMSSSDIALLQSGIVLEPLRATTPGNVAQVYNGSTLVAECDSFADAVELCETYSYTFVRLTEDVDAQDLTVDTLILDLNGHKLENLTVTGTLYGLDSTTDKYDGTNAGTLTGVTGTVQPVWKASTEQIGAVRRYLTVEENGSYSFHRFYVGITNMSLIPASVGAGYTAVFAGDDAVKAQLADTDAFGFSVWVEDYEPVTMSESAESFSAGANSASLHVRNIMKTENDTQTNLSHAAMQVNGKAFITFKNAGKVNSADYTYVLENMVEKLDREYDGFNADQKAALQDMFDRFPLEMDKWTVPNMFHKDPADPWQVWDGTSVNGKFYLAQDMTLTATVQIPAGSKLELDLNGCTLTGDVQLFDICGELTVRDSYRNEPQSKQGVAMGASSSPAPVFNLQQTGTFRLYSGNLTASSQVAGSGGIGVINGGHMEMTGGQIYGGSATELAGGIYVQSGSFTMTGGKVFDCTASDDGQDVYASEDATIDMGMNAEIEDFYQASEQDYASSQTLRYDDRKDIVALLGLSGAPANVTVTDEVVTSRQVGSDTADAHVLTYENGTLYAVGTGTAVLNVDGVYHKVTVDPAKLSLFMITGTSIGVGQNGDATQSVVVEAGQAYSTYMANMDKKTQEDRDSAIDENGGLGIGSADRAGSALDAYAPGQGGNIGEGSAIAWKWHELTGEKVWILNAARGGSSINDWVPSSLDTGYSNYGSHDYAVALFQSAQQVLEKEIAAGHFTLGDMAIIYHNGANFSINNGLKDSFGQLTFTWEQLTGWYDAMWESYQTNFNKDLDGDNKVDTIKIGFSNSGTNLNYDQPLAHYLAATHPDMTMFSTALAGWKADLSTFPAIEYTTQSKPVSRPDSVLHTDQGGTSDNSLYCYKDDVHLSQVGYNALGLDIIGNLHGFLRGDTTVTSVKVTDLDGDQPTAPVELVKGQSWGFALHTEPFYGTGVTVEVTGAVVQNTEAPWLVKATQAGTGKLTVKRGSTVLAEVDFTVSDGHTHCICDSSEAKPTDHVCDANTLWTPIAKSSSSTTVLADGGHYFLDWNGESAQKLAVADNATAYLCLNGASIRAQTLLTLGENAHLHICDCSEKQTGVMTTTYYTPVNVATGQSVTLYSGTISGTYSTSVSRISVILDGGEFNMYGGAITDGCSNPDASRKETETVNGGNVSISDGTFNLYGGEISGGKSTGYGGNIAVKSGTAKLNMYGGTVTGGNAGTHGGNICMALGSFTMEGGSVTDGSAAQYGGNVSVVNNSNATVTGGAITGGTAPEYAPCFNARGTGTFTVGGNAQISDVTLGSGKTIAVSSQKPLTGNKAIGITLRTTPAAGQSVAVVTGAANTDAFTFTNSDMTVTFENSTISLYNPAQTVPGEPFSLKYDDRKDLASLLGVTPSSVSITNEVPTSNQVGTSAKDTHVLAYENGTLFAVGTGTATLTVNSTTYEVTVTPAKISLFMITGTSIGQGDYGEPNKSVAIEAGQAYSTYLGISQNSTPAANHFTGAIDVTGGLGYGSAKRAGTTLDAYAPGQGGNAGEGSGLAYQWNKLTGEKAWVINVARGASSLNRWKAGGDHHQNAITVFTNAQAVVQAEIAAGHFTMGDMAIIYHNGLNFSSTNDLAAGTYTEADLKDWYDGMMESYRQSFNKDLDGDGVDEKIKLTFSNGVASNWTATMTYKHEHDKAMAFYLSVTDPDMAMASDAICDWEKNLDHFPAITYTSQSGAVTAPDSMKHIDNGGSSENSIYCWHDNCHLSQIGYNGLGIDTANNLYGFLRGNRTVNTVSIHDVERNEVNNTTVRIAKGNTWKFAPITLPVYGSGLTFETSGAVVQAAETPWLIEGVEAGTGKLTVKQGINVVAEVNFKVTDGHVHCVCENADATEADHVCNEDTRWEPITSSAANPYEMTDGGHYFLNWEGSVAKGLKVADGATAYLCLNGASIRAQTLVKLGSNSHLVVCDCSKSQTGLLNTTKNAPVTLSAGQSLTLYSGGISGTYSSSASQISVVVNGGSFTMYGGKVYDGCKNAASTANGANIQANSGSVAIYGGCVTGGVTEGLGEDIYIGENASITLGGAPQIGELYLASGKKLTLDGLTATASIGINSADKGDFATGLTGDALANAFTSTAEGYEVSYAGGKLSLAAQASSHKHCWCVNAEYVPADHTCAASTAWTPLTSDTTLEDGGHYFLTEDRLGAITPPAGEIYICLGNQTLSSNIRVITVGSGKTVHLCACGKDGTVHGKYNASGSAIYTDGGTFYLWSGKLTANPVTTYNGGVVATINGGTFTMYGGEICDGTITGTGTATMGGNVNVGKNATFTMYGGEIHDGTSGKYGGNVALTQSTAVFEMKGGKVYNGVSGTHGGNVGGIGTFRMEGGQIYNGTANTYGGNVSIATDGGAVVTGGSITGGTATDNAPCFRMSGSNGFTVGGSATISDVYLSSGKTLTVSTEKPLTGNKSIGLTLATGTAGTAVTGAASADAFRSNMNGFKAVLEGSNVVLVEGEEPSIPLTMKYDDRKDISTLLGFTPTQVEISDQAVTSKQVNTDTPDTAVLKYENGTLYAVGTGTATLKAAGCTYRVTVEKAKLSLFMITGHSIAAGGRGDAAQSVVVEAGQGYSTSFTQKGNDAPLDPDASAATVKGGIGYGSTTRPDTIDQFAPGQGGNVGEGSGLAYQWNKLTGEKAWVINVAKGGSCLNHWAPNSQNEDRLHDLALAVFNNVQKVAKAEFAAGHYELGNMAVIYHNAANFGEYAGYTQESMQKDYADLWESFQQNFNEDLDGDGNVDTVSLGIVPGSTNSLNYDKAVGYYLAATEKHIFNVSDFAREFVVGASASNNYNQDKLSQFPAITYTTQSKPVAVPESLYHSNNGGTSENSFYCKEENTHYQQVVYNAMGMDIAQELLGYLRNGRTVTSAQIVNNNFAAVTEMDMKVGQTNSFAITCDPLYGGELTVETSGVISQLSTPWIIQANAAGTGMLTVKQGNTVVAQLTVTVTN